jgi:DNA-binding NtrC family response regulator
MSLIPSILIYGHDTVLLDTRRQALALWGYEVRTTQSKCGVEGALVQNDFRLLILCYTLTLSESSQSLAFARARQRRIKSLQLIAYDGQRAVALASNLFAVSEGPERFVQCMDQLLFGSRSGR